MKASEILRRARILISDPERWTQGAQARDEKGNKVTAGDRRAIRWCSLGALAVYYPGDDPIPPVLPSDLIREATGEEGVAHFNDTHTHAEILNAFDKAIALAESRGR